MAKKKNTALIIGGIALAGIAVYMLTRKTTTVTTAPTPAPVSSGSSVLTQGASLISSLANLFKGSGSSLLPYTPTVAPTATLGPSPASGINYINPSAIPAISITDPGMSDTAGSGFTDIYDLGV